MTISTANVLAQQSAEDDFDAGLAQLSLLSPRELATLTCAIFVTMRAAGVPLPPALQDEVDEAVLEYEHGRCLPFASVATAGVAS